MSKIVEVITNSFINSEDKEAVEKDLSKYIITFRPCGLKALQLLKKGAGAKPHDILEKTIKITPRTNLDEYQQKLIKAFGKAGVINGLKFFQGFVGHWDAEGNLVGVYLTTLGARVLSATAYRNNCKEIITQVGGERFLRYYLQLDSNYRNVWDALKVALDSKYIGKNLNVEVCFFAGDYDLHDIIRNNNFMIEDTVDFQNFLVRINDAIYQKNPHLLTLFSVLQDDEKDDYRRVQHGTQFNYIAHVLNHEFDALGQVELVKTVMRMSLPLAAFKNNEWFLITSKEEYIQFIKNCGLTPKVIWTDDAEMEKFIRSLENIYKKRITIS